MRRMRALIVSVLVCLVGCGGNNGGGTGGGSGGSGGTGGTGGATGGGTGGATGGGSGGSTGGGTGGGAPTDAGTLTLGETCGQYLDAICEYNTRCGFTETKAGCLAVSLKFNPWFPSTCLLEERAAITGGRATFDGAAAASCVYKLRNSLPCGANPATYAPECETVLRGQVTTGACARTFECMQGNYCDSSLGMCPGVCRPRKPTGADAGSSEECQPGQYEYDGKCRLFAFTGTSCAPIAPSVQPQQCRPGEAFCSAGTCIALRQETYPCTSESDCVFPLVCQNMTCVRRSAVGQRCSYGYPSPPQPCKLDLACEGPFHSDGGTCRLPGGQGSTCFNEVECTGNLKCTTWSLAFLLDAGVQVDAGRCVQPAQAGAACVTGNGDTCERLNTYCDAGQCRLRRDAGSMGSCLAEDHCTPPDVCIGGTCRKPYCAQ